MAGVDGVDGSSNASSTNDAQAEAARRAAAEQAQATQQQQQQSRSCGGTDEKKVDDATKANAAANQKWQDYRQTDGSVKDPKLPPKGKAAAPNAANESTHVKGAADAKDASSDANALRTAYQRADEIAKKAGQINDTLQDASKKADARSDMPSDVKASIKDAAQRAEAISNKANAVRDNLKKAVDALDAKNNNGGPTDAERAAGLEKLKQAFADKGIGGDNKKPTPAEEAQQKADAAKTTSNDAKTAADAAQKTADDAKKTAEDAQKNADEMKKNESVFTKMFGAKPTAADKAQTQADASKKVADETKKTADDAQRAADSAKFAEGVEKLKDAFAKQAQEQQKQTTPTKETSAPSKLDKVLEKNPDIKSNQDLINKFYKDGGGTWEGAAKEAKKAGVTMTELVRDRQGDSRKTAESKRTGQPTETTPAETKPSTETKAGPASETKSGPATPAAQPIAAKDKIPGGPDRSQFDKELKDPKVAERLKALTVAEVGSKNPQAQRALMESIFNRAQATHKSLMETMNSRYYEPMQHGGGAYRRADAAVKNNPALSKQLDAAMFDVRRGSNVSNYATDNASGSVARSAARSQVITARIGGETFSRKEGFRGGVHHPDYRPWLRSMPRNPSDQKAAA